MDKITSTTAKVTKASVQAAICSWNIRFPECSRDGNILDFLSREYFEDLESENVSMDEFSAACKVVRKNCTFFPKVADILKAVREYRERPPAAKEPITTLLADETSKHDLTPEEIARNKARVKLIVKALAGGMSFDEAEREVAAMGHIGEFSTMAGKREYRA